MKRKAYKYFTNIKIPMRSISKNYNIPKPVREIHNKTTCTTQHTQIELRKLESKSSPTCTTVKKNSDDYNATETLINCIPIKKNKADYNDTEIEILFANALCFSFDNKYKEAAKIYNEIMKIFYKSEEEYDNEMLELLKIAHGYSISNRMSEAIYIYRIVFNKYISMTNYNNLEQKINRCSMFFEKFSCYIRSMFVTLLEYYKSNSCEKCKHVITEMIVMDLLSGNIFKTNISEDSLYHFIALNASDDIIKFTFDLMKLKNISGDILLNKNLSGYTVIENAIIGKNLTFLENIKLHYPELLKE